MEEQKIKKATKIGLSILGCIIITFLLLGRNDGLMLMQWYLNILFLGIISIPLSTVLFGDNKCLYPFSKTLGVLIPGFMMWVAGVVFKLPFTRLNCFIIISIYFLLNIGIIMIKSKSFNKVSSDISKDFLSKCFIPKYELIFFLMFLIWVYLVGFKPSAYGTEKFMDYAFLQKMLVSSQLPPDDVWYAGEYLNYYYGGQYYAAFLCKSMIFKQALAETGYNLMRSLIPALFFLGIFSLVEQMVLDSTKKPNLANVFALFSAILTVFAGNGHYVVYRLFKGQADYWFPDATRYIGYNPPVKNDMTIHEFPCYSFLLGDLHAHMINIMFVILLLALSYSLLKTLKKESKISIKTISLLLIMGLTWGLFNWTNYWDFIIYLVVVLITIIAGNLISNDNVKWTFKIRNIVIEMLVFGLTGYVAVMPFTCNFKSVFKGVCLTQNHTPIYQLLILWGIPIGLALCFIFIFLKNFIKDKFKFNKKECCDTFAFILVCCAIGLVFIPEIVYVKDIYEATHARANTMFKLTYQAYILFGIACGYLIIKLISYKNQFLTVFACIFATLNILTLGYFANATNAWCGEWYRPSARQSLNALVYLDENDFKDEKQALLWMKNKSEAEEIKGAIAEAPGDSYTAYERVSTISGASAVAGWKVHEWLWRDSLEGIDKRFIDMDSLYSLSSTDIKNCKNIIDKYNIEYIFAGQREVEKYGEHVKETVKNLGTIVYEDNGAVIIQTN